MATIEEKIKRLPPDLQREVETFVEYLLDTNGQSKRQKLKLTWAGGLKDFKDKYTSLELQKQAMEWWGD